MNFRKESVFRVGGAILFGFALVGGALFVQKNAAARAAMDAAPAMVIARGDVRATAPALDSDKDGLPDWEEALRGTDPHTYTMLATTTENEATSTQEYQTPTTLTDRFAETFLKDMIRTGAGKTMTAEEQAALVGRSVEAIAGAAKEKLYTQASIKSTAGNDLIALHDYGNRLGALLLVKSSGENELSIMQRATTGHDQDALKELTPIADGYARMERALLALETPGVLARQHVDLVNSIAMVRADVAAMQNVFDDPISALVHLRRHPDDARRLLYAINNIRAALEANGVAFTSDEPGIFLFSLRP
jgi:hypothetical protein